MEIWQGCQEGCTHRGPRLSLSRKQWWETGKNILHMVSPLLWQPSYKFLLFFIFVLTVPKFIFIHSQPLFKEKKYCEGNEDLCLYIHFFALHKVLSIYFPLGMLAFLGRGSVIIINFKATRLRWLQCLCKQTKT